MPSTYDFAYLKALVTKKLQGDAYFSETDIEDALNESQDDLAIFSKSELTSTVLTLVAGTDIYDWPTDALIVDGINYNGVELDAITQEEWRKLGGLSANNRPTTVAPTSYAVRGRQIILWPKPNNTVPPCLVFYIPKPAELTADTDVPSVPRTFTKAWVHLAVSNLLEMDAGRLAEAQYHYDMYLKRRAENAVNQNSSRKRKFRNTYPRAVRL